jgi:hypothetical protein
MKADPSYTITSMVCITTRQEAPLTSIEALDVLTRKHFDERGSRWATLALVPILFLDDWAEAAE